MPPAGEERKQSINWELISPPVVLPKPLQSVDSKRPVGLVCWKSRRGRKLHQMPSLSKEERRRNKSWWVTLFCNMRNHLKGQIIWDLNGRCYELWLTFQMCTWQQVGHRRGSEICPPAVWKQTQRDVTSPLSWRYTALVCISIHQ